MAQNENRWRDEGREVGRDWRDEDRWRGEGRRYGGENRDESVYGERGASGRGGGEWQGGREVYRGYTGGESSGGFGRDTHSRDNAREMERVYDRNFGGGHDESRSGYGAGYGGRSGSSGFGGYSGAGRDESRGDYSRGYGAGYGERDMGRDYGRDYSGDAIRNHGGGSSGSDYERQRGGFSQSRGYGGGYAAGYGTSYEGRGRDYGNEQRRGRGEDRGFWAQAGDEIASWFGDDDAQNRRQQDEQRAAQHRGRGPRGYTRSDDRVREDVSDRLTDDPYVDASEIDIAISGGEVTLSGTVPDRSTKRRAEDIAESVSGVSHVQNNLRVRQQTGTGAGTLTGSSTGAGASAMAGAGTGAGTGMGSTGSTTGGSTGTGSTAGSTAGSTSGTGTSASVRRT